MPSAPDSTPAPHLDHDLPCATCEYNLRGIAETGVCPECGTAVAKSVAVERMGRVLASTSSAWRRLVLGGLVLWLITLAMDLVLEVYFLGVFLSHRRAPGPWADAFIDLDGVLTAVAVWMVTARHRRFEVASPVLRWGSRLLLTLAVLDQLVARWLINRYTAELAWCVNGTAMSLVEFAAAAMFLIVIARYGRLGRESLAGRCRGAVAVWGVVAGLSILNDWIYYKVLLWRRMSAQGVAVRIPISNFRSSYQARGLFSVAGTLLTMRIAYLTMRMFLRSLDETVAPPHGPHETSASK